MAEEEEKPQQHEQQQSEFIIEVCKDCKTHASHTRHVEGKYNAIFEEVAKIIQAECPGHTVVKNKGIKRPALGAFEVTHNGNLIFSKLKSTIFPDPAKLIERVKLYLDDVQAKADVSKYATIQEKIMEPTKKDFSKNEEHILGKLNYTKSQQKLKQKQMKQSQMQQEEEQQQLQQQQDNPEQNEQDQENQYQGQQPQEDSQQEPQTQEEAPQKKQSEQQQQEQEEKQPEEQQQEPLQEAQE